MPSPEAATYTFEKIEQRAKEPYYRSLSPEFRAAMNYGNEHESVKWECRALARAELEKEERDDTV